MTAAGKAPKNHMKDNLDKIRNAQRQNREKAALDAVKVDERFELKQFREVRSKVSDAVRSDRSPPADDDRERPFLRKGVAEEKQRKKEQDSRAKAAQRDFTQRKKSSLPVEASAPRPVEAREARNFQKENARKVIKSKPVNVMPGDAPAKPKDFGKVPKYLQKRQEELRQEEEVARQLADIDMDCPSGMRLLPEAERVETLKILEQNKEKVTAEVGAMPFVVDTHGLKKRKQALENKLKDIDEAVKIFSRRKVYVEV